MTEETSALYIGLCAEVSFCCRHTDEGNDVNSTGSFICVFHILLSVPGIEHASMQWDGFGDDTRLPKQSNSIHITLFVV